MGAYLEKPLVNIPGVEDWHRRFVQQAGWTKNLRHYLYNLVGISNACKILDVGCGTGALLSELLDWRPAMVHGIDINRSNLSYARQQAPGGFLNQADAHNLPYISQTFDIALCHFLLLWVHDPHRVVAEMARVTRPGGSVLILAEPDYGARIDYPDSMLELGRWQEAALRRQGADSHIGRKINRLLADAGLEHIETGVLGGQWHYPPNWQEWMLEWAILRSDLKDSVPIEILGELQQQDRQAWEDGHRVLYVPTFYAWGKVPS